MKTRTAPTYILNLLLGLAFILGVLPSTAIAGGSTAGVIEEQARELLAGIGRQYGGRETASLGSDRFSFFGRVEQRARRARPRIAIWPFEQQDIPIPKDVADQFNDMLLAAMTRHSNGRHDFVARESLRALIADMEQTGALDAGANDPIATLMESAQDVSVLIVGKLATQGDDVLLSYKAVRVNSDVLVGTRPSPVRLDWRDRNTDRAVLSLNQALNAAAQHLADQAHDLRHLRQDGVRFEETGLQPPFGRYVIEKLSAKLQHEFANRATGGSLKVTEARLNFEKLSQGRGVHITHKDLQITASPEDRGKGVYTLTGTYWDVADAVEIRLSLIGVGASTVSWAGRVRKDTLGGLKIYPLNEFVLERGYDNLGPIGFTLTTSRGPEPAFRIGEKVDLAIRLTQDAWVYCYYRQADGSTIQIFPNPHFWTIYSEPKLEGRRVHIIPGETTFPFEVTASPPIGEELMKCFALSKNVTDLLPQALKGLSLEPLPSTVDRKLSHIFRSLPNTSVSEASVAITVVR